MTIPKQSELDAKIMARAIAQAKLAEDIGEVPVGAVIYDPKAQLILTEAHNQPIGHSDPTAHAEILALRDAARKLGNYRLTGCALYVSLEPCTMCAAAISNARISRLIFGASDEKGGAVINGVKFFDQPSCHWKPDIIAGINAEESAQMLKSFFKVRRKK